MFRDKVLVNPAPRQCQAVGQATDQDGKVGVSFQSQIEGFYQLSVTTR